jgi:hypothetical protein
MSNQIDQALQFLNANLEFFAAPVVDGEAFSSWANPLPAMHVLSFDLRTVLKKIEFIAFFDALVGKALDKDDAKHAMITGNDKRMRNLLTKRPEIVAVLVSHMNNPVIEQWYQTEATSTQLALRQFRQVKSYYYACAVYEKYLNKQIACAGANAENMPVIEAAKAKLIVIQNGMNMLTSKDNLNTQLKVSAFFSYLELHRALLTTRRDSGLLTFVKALGVIASSIFGLGVGGYYAYQRLFGVNATRSGQLINQCHDTRAVFNRNN